jgi:hypothetical protein
MSARSPVGHPVSGGSVMSGFPELVDPLLKLSRNRHEELLDPGRVMVNLC